MSASAPQTLNRLHQALAPFHHQYDPVLGMLKAPFKSIGFLKFFSGLPVHPTRESVAYAAALLDTEDSQLHQRAIRILRQVVSLQDQQPNSPTYGVWPKYLEEKPFKIVQPDQNWSNFLGTFFLQIALRQEPRLPPSLTAEIAIAINHAARSIQRRNVTHEYTNIAIMGIYVTLITAQLYQIPDLYDYALTRLRTFYDYTLAQGGFSEYNSPTYTIITLEVLGRLRLHVEDDAAKQLVEALYRLAWEEIGSHFHPSTQQWAGPHSRSYSTFLEASVLALIERSTSEQVHFGIAETHPTIDEHWLVLPCPPDLESYFLPITEPRTLSKSLCQKKPTQVLTTYITPAFSLGSVNYSDFWHQRRSLLAYWGTFPSPCFLWLRCLHNGVDFAAAQLSSVQREGQVLAGVSLAKDLHPVNPYIQGKRHNTQLLTQDLRLRFELSGPLGASPLKTPLPPLIDATSWVHLYCNPLHLKILIPYAQFGDTIARWEVHQTSSGLALDVVFWTGKQRVFDRATLERAAIGVVLQITTADLPPPEVGVRLDDPWLEMNWNSLRLKVLTRPDQQQVLNASIVS